MYADHMAGKQDLALVDNLDEIDPDTSLTVHFEKGTKFSVLPPWVQERTKDNPLLFRRVRVESREVLVEIDDDEDDEPREPNRTVHTQV